MRVHRYLLPLAALVAVVPMPFAGPSCGHDFDFHVLSWVEAAQQLLHAHYPAWAYTPAWNAGEPRFVFYPPLSWITGSLLRLLLPWHFVPIAYTWVALTLSGFSLHRLAARYATPAAATLAAVFYMVNPYMLFTAYERTAYGELLAAAWIPLLLAAILAPRVSVLAVAVPVALLWLTNAPAAVMSCYALALLALVRLVALGIARERKEALALAWKTTAGVLLGLALSAFYVLPAAWEQRYVQTAMATVQGMRIVDNTLFHHTPDEAHDAVLHTASLLAVLLLTALAGALLSIQDEPRAAQPSPLKIPVIAVSILAGVIAFLLTPWSLGVWRHAPELAFLQFPWRLLAILAALLALAGALVIRNLHLRPVRVGLVSLAVVAGFVLPAWSHFNQPCDTEDTVEARVALFHTPLGTDPTDEYTPSSADNDALRHGNPPYWLAGSPQAAPPQAAPGPLPDRFSVSVPMAETLILNRRQYPGWTINVNGHEVKPDPPGTRDDGLIAVPVPAGEDSIELRFRRSADEEIGLGLSLVALGGVVFLRRPLRGA